MTMKCPCKKTAQFCTTNCNCGIGPTKECQNKQLELKKSVSAYYYVVNEY